MGAPAHALPQRISRLAVTALGDSSQSNAETVTATVMAGQSPTAWGAVASLTFSAQRGSFRIGDEVQVSIQAEAQ